MNQKLKRIAAWVGIVLLAGMYISTLVFALIGNDFSRAMLMASVVATLIVPVLLYLFTLGLGLLPGKQSIEELEDSSENSDEAGEV